MWQDPRFRAAAAARWAQLRAGPWSGAAIDGMLGSISQQVGRWGELRARHGALRRAWWCCWQPACSGRELLRAVAASPPGLRRCTDTSLTTRPA